MILADENIDHQIIEAIREIGIEVFSVFEQNRGLLDKSIIEFSRNPQRIILTEDKDFGEWVFAHNIKNISVIFLRYEFKETAKMIEVLKGLFSQKQEELFGKFTTVTIQKIRSREI